LDLTQRVSVFPARKVFAGIRIARCTPRAHCECGIADSKAYTNDTRMEPTFPPSFGAWPGRHDMNLRVLRRVLSPSIVDYTLSVPAVSVYERLDGEWRKLHVMGPLFVAAVRGSPDPLIVVLTTVNAEVPKNYTLAAPRASARLFVRETQLHVRVGPREVLFSADSADDAARLADGLEGFAPRCAAGAPAPAPGPPRTASQYANKDPTYQHLLRMLSRL
jgi:hypothetical protein